MELFKQELIAIVGNSVVAILLIAVVYSIFISIQEKEKRAAKRLAIVFVLIVVLGIALNIISIQLLFPAIWLVFLGMALMISIILFSPWPEADIQVDFSDEKRIDERTIMFSRAELEPGSKKFEEYYTNHPEHQEADDKWRESPGLLHDQSAFYHPFLYATADAAFYAVSGLHSKIDGPVKKVNTALNPEELSRFDVVHVLHSPVCIVNRWVHKLATVIIPQDAVAIFWLSF